MLAEMGRVISVNCVPSASTKYFKLLAVGDLNRRIE